MSILTIEDRKDLVYSCRRALLEHVDSSGILTESTRAAARHFILNEASYQDLLNLVYNPERDTKYLKTEVLEKIALKTYAAHLHESAKPKKSAFGIIEGNIRGTVSNWGRGFVDTLKGDKIKKAKDAINTARKKRYKAGIKKASKELLKRRIQTHGARAATAAAGVGVVGGSYALGKKRGKRDKKEE